MKNLIFIIVLLTIHTCFGQISTEQYLKENRQDLRQSTSIDIGESKMIGFGALHGSSKTEETELIILNDLIRTKNLKYYFPETDFSTALYFQEYIETGNEQLLKELIYEYGERVPQERSIESFNKWKNVRQLFNENNIQIVGIDKIASYKFSVIQILKLTKNIENVYLDSLKLLTVDKETNWVSYYKTDTKKILENFVTDYQENKNIYLKNVNDTVSLIHIINNLKLTFEKSSREQIIYENYKKLSNDFKPDNSIQFFRFGVFHIMKSRINNSSSFFNRLIENNDYSKSEILTIQGFLTKSKVLWNVKFDKHGNYSSYTKKAGFGISDYWLEHYKDIRKLKTNTTSDITLFKLKEKYSPYIIVDDYKLVEIKKIFRKSFWNLEEGKSSVDYIDYAILISDSKANVPIEELE